MSICLLLLLAWHFSIQATAHNTARSQVRAWMSELGASAGDIQFRMLRGALTINNINLSIDGNPLHIQQLLLKGNPATITSAKPLLNQVTITQATFDAYAISQPWQQPSFELPASINNILYQAKRISIQQSSIRHLSGLPELFIRDIRIQSPDNQRRATGHGYIAPTQQPWSLELKLPSDNSLQTGHLQYRFHDISHELNWSGAWKHHNLRIVSEQSMVNSNASLRLELTQQQQQWLNNFEAERWPVAAAAMQSTITGKGRINGTPDRWEMNTPLLTLEQTSFKAHEFNIAHMVANDVHLDASSKLASIGQLDLEHASLTLDIDQPLSAESDWQLNLNNITIHELDARLLYQQNPIKIPTLSGQARAKNHGVEFDLASLPDNATSLRLQSDSDGRVDLSARHAPLVQLRSLLPDPFQQQASTLEGDVALDLSISPLKQWQTAGSVQVDNIILGSEHQIFKAASLQMDIQHADTSGVQQASLQAKEWLMQFPLTPRQAWSESSYLNDWATIPWGFETIDFSQGSVAIGQEEQVWLDHVQLKLHHWQSSQAATLELNGEFGLSPIHIAMNLSPDENHFMQWRQFKLKTRDANLFALSDWLKISELPSIDMGHISLDLEATQIDGYTQGLAKIELNQMHLTPVATENSLPLQDGQFSFHHLADQLNRQNAMALHAPFQGHGEWISTATTALLHTFQSQSEKSPARKERRSLLGSLRIHQSNEFSQNERSRLRQMLKIAKAKRRSYLEITPELGTAELTPELSNQIYRTQVMARTFLSDRGFKAKNIYIIQAQPKHKSTSSTAAIHINLVN